MATLFNEAQIFTIPELSGTYIVYVPLHGVVLRAQPAHVNALAAARETGRQAAEDAEPEFIQALLAAGLNDASQAFPRPVAPAPAEFMPNHLTLFLTTGCNLRCVYCYAHGEHRAMTMPHELALAAVDELLRYVRKAGGTSVDIAFHGGGEPTQAWKVLTTVVEHARRRAGEQGVACRFGIATNGCVTRAQAAWLAANMDSINVSLDGPPRVQDRQRPTVKGSRSSTMVRRTIRAFESAGKSYTFQATVLADSLSAMQDTVRYVARHTTARQIKFEPVMPDGRFRGEDDKVPAAEAFAEAFDRAFALGQRLGVNVMFSALRLFDHPKSCFCGAFETPFGVTPDGHVSACYETFAASCEGSSAFLFGAYNPGTRRFDIDMAKLAHLRTRRVDDMPSCGNCFCKYSCAGDCASRNLHHFGGRDLLRVGARCDVIRAVVRRHLQRLLNTVRDGECFKANPNGEKHE